METVDLRSFFKSGTVFFEEDVAYLYEYLNIRQTPGIPGSQERMAQLRNILEDIVDFDRI